MKQLSVEGSSHCVSGTHSAHLSVLDRRG